MVKFLEGFCYGPSTCVLRYRGSNPQVLRSCSRLRSAGAPTLSNRQKRTLSLRLGQEAQALLRLTFSARDPREGVPLLSRASAPSAHLASTRPGQTRWYAALLSLRAGERRRWRRDTRPVLRFGTAAWFVRRRRGFQHLLRIGDSVNLVDAALFRTKKINQKLTFLLKI